MQAKEHYDNHLGYFYSWMVGDFDEKQKEQEAYFIRNNIRPGTNKTALDLGAGHGLQTISLAKLGFKVVAVDFNRQLLEELEARAKGKEITILEGDIKNYSLYASFHPALIVCMGDTITHLHSEGEVKNLLQNSAEILEPGGKIILSFRDFSAELKSTDRFIPVRSDERRIHTCFVEYFPDHVAVTDILHEKEKGHWAQKISAYRKLRIPEERMCTYLEEAGLKIKARDKYHNMNYLIAEKV